MDLDLKRIDAKVQFIMSNLELLQELSSSSESDFVADRVKFYAAVHALQISIEALLDVFTHVISRLHLGTPRNDRQVLDIALAKGLVSQEHHQKFVEMNKFRNKVVHGYMDVDAKTVFKMLHEDPVDFDLFFADVKRIVEMEQAGEKNGKQRKSKNTK